jgi:hypothetical protein
MAVTTLAKPATDFQATFTLTNRSTPHQILYGVTADGKIYRHRVNHDSVGGGPGGNGTYVDTGLTVPDVSIVTDL